MFCLDEFLKSGAVFSLGGQSVILAWGKPKRFTGENELDRNIPAYYFIDFFLKAAKPWIQYPHWEELTIDDLLVLLVNELHPKANWQIGHKQVFEKSFDRLQKSFDKKILKKAVPYIFSYSKDMMTSSRLKNCLLNGLKNIQKFPGILYGHWDEILGIIGVTPETLFTHQNVSSTVETMAVAGTLPTNCNLVDQKTIHEHQIVVDYIEDALKPYGTVKCSPVEMLQLSRFSHLKTPIQVHLEEPFNFSALVSTLHPTPALGAFPKEQGMVWLQDYQTQVQRDYFGAPVGIIYKGNAYCHVAIRQVQWNREGMRIGAGCGVIKESQYEEEWNEIELKVTAIKELLAL